MTVVQALWSEGGIARASQLRGVVSRYALQRAVDQGLVIHPSRGLYCLPDRLNRATVRAIHGVVSHLSAAEVWELGVLEPPADFMSPFAATAAASTVRTASPSITRIFVRPRFVGR